MIGGRNRGEASRAGEVAPNHMRAGVAKRRNDARLRSSTKEARAAGLLAGSHGAPRTARRVRTYPHMTALS